MHDAGVVMGVVIGRAGSLRSPDAPVVRICPAEAFIGLLHRGVVLVCNSSERLIECAALACTV